MKTIELKIYSFGELNEEAQTVALRNREKMVCENGINCTGEIFDSLKGLIDCTRYTLLDWSLGGSDNRGQNIKLDSLDTDSLSGKRALAWLDNTVLSPLRIPWGGEGRKDVAKYGKFYRAGLVRPCPFTGFCFDDDFLAGLKKNIKEGMEVRDALQCLDSVYASLVDVERGHQTSFDYFREECSANEYDFLGSGERY